MSVVLVSVLTLLSVLPSFSAPSAGCSTEPPSERSDAHTVDKLGVTVGIDVQGKEEKNNSGMGASNAVQTVGEVSRLPESHITLTGVVPLSLTQ